MGELRVLVLEDDPVTASVYEEYLRRIPGVRAEYTAHGLDDVLRFAAGRRRVMGEPGIDLMLVDMNLRDGHGLDALRHLRASGWRGGAIAVTAASEREVVRGAVALGITDYLLKPFTFDDLATRIAAFRDLDRRLGTGGAVADQAHLDDIFAASRGAAEPELPKGLLPDTLSQVTAALAFTDTPLSARETAAATGLSRVTARRYLEHLVDTGRAVRASRHGTPGRPEVEYSPLPG